MISFAAIVVTLAISAVTVFLLSSARTVVEEATNLLSALLVECLTVAYEGIEHLMGRIYSEVITY